MIENNLTFQKKKISLSGKVYTTGAGVITLNPCHGNG